MPRTRIAAAVLLPFLMACGADNTSPTAPPAKLVLTTDVLKSLDSTARAMEQANPTNADVKALADSTLLVLSAGVEAKRLDVSTDLTTAPLYFVAVHRATDRAAGGSSSTWTLVGFDDPTHLTTLVEVSGFAQASSASAPGTVSGTIGDGTGIVNALFLKVASDGSVTQRSAGSGSASFASDAPGDACATPPTAANATCALETTHTHFTASATSGSGGAAARHATLATDTAVPAMRLTYVF